MPRRPLSAQQNAQRRKVYDATNSDIEAAESLGLSLSGFKLWRKAQGLPAKGRGGRKPASAKAGRPSGRGGKIRCPKCGHHMFTIDV
ncbi:MAG TPA: hypothetical protein VNZ52_11275 [Candidatus Thermoplasmatota archaeon]|nr:hypothetical protein [Candidatus Thermoplasmatota archaeon]